MAQVSTIRGEAQDWQTDAFKYTVDLVLMERPREGSDWSPLPIPVRADLLTEPQAGVEQGSMVALHGVQVSLKTSKVTDGTTIEVEVRAAGFRADRPHREAHQPHTA